MGLDVGVNRLATNEDAPAHLVASKGPTTDQLEVTAPPKRAVVLAVVHRFRLRLVGHLVPQVWGERRRDLAEQLPGSVAARTCWLRHSDTPLPCGGELSSPLTHLYRAAR